MKKSYNKRLLFILILFISIGFAYLTRDLSLSGISSIFRNTWDVHLENIEVKEGSVNANEPVIDSNRSSVTFSVELDTPGDFYEFNVDAVNGGTIDAMLDTYSGFNLTEDQQKILDYTITYKDGEELVQYQELNSGETLTYKIRIEYKLDITEEDLPDENESVELTFTVDFIQADANRIKRRAENTLYNVLKNEAESGGLAKKYAGEHQDSMDASKSTKDIYHWYATNNTDGTAVQNLNNVIFANHCWNMLRTTDTGGVKLIYNGEAENNQCLNTRGTHVGYNERTTQALSTTYYYGTSYDFDKINNVFVLSGNVTTGTIKEGQYTCKETTNNAICSTLYYVDTLKNGTSYYVIPLKDNSHYSQFGELQFNQDYGSLSSIGYMYKTNEYSDNWMTMTTIETVLLSKTLSIDYWYADSFTWGSPEESKYNLNNPYQISTANDYQNLVGKYTFTSNSQNYSSSIVKYIVGVNDTTMYYVELRNTTNHNLNDINYKLVYGESYTDNGDGTYTIINPITTYRTDWFTEFTNLGPDKYVCKNANNNICTDLWYITETSQVSLSYIKVSNVYKYSKKVVWDGSKYILDNSTSVSFWNITDSTNKESINNAHYTCWNSSGECTTLSFIYSLSNNTPYYIKLNSGKDSQDAVNEMLYNDDVNTINSIMKTGVEAWYEKYLLDYSDYLEDVIFCNNRRQSNSSSNGWNPNGGNLTIKMYFDDYDNLNCQNTIDRFSTLNDKAKLKYKTGLITYREIFLLNNKNIYITGKNYWLGSPNYMVSSYAYEWYIRIDGTFGMYNAGGKYGVRPAISLKPDTFYTSGDGSMENPYVIYTE